MIASGLEPQEPAGIPYQSCRGAPVITEGVAQAVTGPFSGPVPRAPGKRLGHSFLALPEYSDGRIIAIPIDQPPGTEY